MTTGPALVVTVNEDLETDDTVPRTCDGIVAATEIDGIADAKSATANAVSQ